MYHKPNQTKSYSIYLHEEGFALNNLQALISHVTKPNKTNRNFAKESLRYRRDEEIPLYWKRTIKKFFH